MTHTYAILDISQEAYAEIRGRLEKAGYEHAIIDKELSSPKRELIDMHGIAVRASEGPTLLTVRTAEALLAWARSSVDVDGLNAFDAGARQILAELQTTEVHGDRTAEGLEREARDATMGLALIILEFGGGVDGNRSLLIPAATVEKFCLHSPPQHVERRVMPNRDLLYLLAPCPSAIGPQGPLDMMPNPPPGSVEMDGHTVLLAKDQIVYCRTHDFGLCPEHIGACSPAKTSSSFQCQFQAWPTALAEVPWCAVCCGRLTLPEAPQSEPEAKFRGDVE